MHYVYILTDSTNNIYIGLTDDLERRLKEHRAGKTRTTKSMDVVNLHYYEAYTSRHAAIEREKNLKCYGSAYMGLLKRIRLK